MEEGARPGLCCAGATASSSSWWVAAPVPTALAYPWCLQPCCGTLISASPLPAQKPSLLPVHGVFPFLLNISPLCFCPNDTWNDLSVSRARFWSWCMPLAGGLKPPAGTGRHIKRGFTASQLVELGRCPVSLLQHMCLWGGAPHLLRSPVPCWMLPPLTVPCCMEPCGSSTLHLCPHSAGTRHPLPKHRAEGIGLGEPLCFPALCGLITQLSHCRPCAKRHLPVHDSGLHCTLECCCGGRAAAHGVAIAQAARGFPAALIGEGCSSAAKVLGSNLANNRLPSPPHVVPLNPIITSAKLPRPRSAPQ